jgi:hypothetical protein
MNLMEVEAGRGNCDYDAVGELRELRAHFEVGTPHNKLLYRGPWFFLVFRIRIQSGQWICIRIRIQEGKNGPQN